MFEKAALLFIYTETPLHAGSGSGLGLVDLPVQRERVTYYPLVQASGIKGALRESAARDHGPRVDEVVVLFGPDTERAADHAGAVSPGDARLLLFPVRSLLDIFAWTTSRDALARFTRDAEIAGLALDWDLEGLALTDDNSALIPTDCRLVADGEMVLEEFAYGASEHSEVTKIATWLAKTALPAGEEYTYWREKLQRSLVVLPENAFRHFTQFATEVVTRIRIDPEKKTVVKGGLWTEEYVPADALLYAPLHVSGPRKPRELIKQPRLQDADGILAVLKEAIPDRLKLGGDETVGRGLVALRVLE